MGSLDLGRDRSAAARLLHAAGWWPARRRVGKLRGSAHGGALLARGSSVNQPRFVAFVATAFVLYVSASAGAANVALDAGSGALLLVMLSSALLPLWLGRFEHDRGPRLV